MNLHEKLKFEREKNGYSLGELSKLTGLSRTTIHGYETGKIKNIPNENLLMFSNIYRKDPNYFILDNDSITLSDIPYITSEEKNKELLSSALITIRIYMEKMNISEDEINKFLKKLYKFLIKNME